MGYLRTDNHMTPARVFPCSVKFAELNIWNAAHAVSYKKQYESLRNIGNLKQPKHDF